LILDLTKIEHFLMALFSGLIEPLAALLGYLSTKIVHFALPVALGFAAGAMFFVICQEVFPELFSKGHERRTTFGVISGIAVMVALANFRIAGLFYRNRKLK